MKLIVEQETYVDKDGTEYISVEVDGRSHYGDYPGWLAMIDWAIATFGPEADRWHVSNKRFWFRDKQDAEWFLLRWS